MIRLNDILDEVLSYHSNAELELIQKAYVYSARAHHSQVRSSGEPYLSHPLEVAFILSQMKLDVVAISAGLLHDTVEDTTSTIADISNLFGDEVGNIVDGVTKISQLEFRKRDEQQAETIRKMIVAMANDIRVLLVKIADRLHNMRTLGYLSEERQHRIAKETLDIYAPLAGRLGLRRKKSELEDLAFYYLEPDKYREIRSGIAQNQEERKKYSTEIQDSLTQMLAENHIDGKVKGRLKHIYSIYQKMVKQSLTLNQVYDLMAFRIIVQTVRDCYETLGIIHNTWTPIPGRFKDYIAMPKSNMYQSLHTTVVGPFGERIEVQIRTEEMDRVSEEGIAAHWRYKEGGNMGEAEGERFAWLRRLLDWMRDLEDPRDFLENLRVDLYPDEVYVFTPQGEVRAFPRGATPLDFAYAIHSEVGHSCTGAKVDGKLVPLKYELNNGEIIEIITSPRSTPSKDWINIAKTSKARAKIRHWFMQEERERSQTLGRELLEKELRKHKKSFPKFQKEGQLDAASAAFSFKNSDDLLAAVGYGRVSAKQVLGKVLPKEELAEEEEPVFVEPTVPKSRKDRPKGGITVRGIHDVLVKLGKCCNPLPGEDIVGFITRGRGVTVHRYDCPVIRTSDPARRVEVDWELATDGLHPARLQLLCEDKKGLLAVISNVFSGADSNIIKGKVERAGDQKSVLDFTIEVQGRKHLDKVVLALKKIKEVIKVERLRA